MKMRSAERRRHARFPVRIRIQYRTADQFFQDYVKNVSIGGIFVETSNPLAKGTRLQVEFSLPGMKAPIRTEGVVVHRLPGKSGLGVGGGMGIRFSELDQRSKKVLEDYVCKEQRS